MSQDHSGAGGFARSNLGVALIGCGRMGTHRARLAAEHPAVRFLAVSDIDLGNARILAERTGAQVATDDARAVIDHPDVTCVVVSTPEDQHTDLVLQAIAAGKPVLIEKPLATTREEADALITAARNQPVSLRVGYSVRFRRNAFLAKRYIDEGRLGQIIGGVGRVFNSRAQAFAILERVADVSPVVDVLTYWVDLIGWLMPDNPPVEVYAAGHGTVLRRHAGSDGPDDITNAIVRYADGAVVGFAISYALPAEFPTLGQGVRVEVIGTDGVVLIDEDNRQNVVFSDRGIHHAYVPGHSVQMAYLGSTTSGDWALGRMFGPIAEETRSWLDHLSTGSVTHIATPEEARTALEVTLAMEESARSGQPVKVAVS